jgi:cysteine synthase B
LYNATPAKPQSSSSKYGGKSIETQATYESLIVPGTSDSYQARIKNVKKKIGNTPIVQMEKIKDNHLFAKLEYYNPFSQSVKDRTAAYLLTGPITRGEINPVEDKIWIEASSGNLGIAYGKIGTYLGLKTHIVVPSIVGEATYNRVKGSALTCEITPGGYCPRGEKDGAIRRVVDIWMSDTDKFVFLDQYSNSDNIYAHEVTTGPEFWQQTHGEITTLVLGVGTGGTIIGSAKYLKSENPDIRIIAVKPKIGNHVQGVRNYEESMKPIVFQDYESLVDGWVEVSDKEAFDATAYLWKHGFKVGTSSGLNYAATRKIAKITRGEKIGTLFPDSHMNSSQIVSQYIETGKIKDILYS